jgi:hypothetical protein
LLPEPVLAFLSGREKLYLLRQNVQPPPLPPLGLAVMKDEVAQPPLCEVLEVAGNLLPNAPGLLVEPGAEEPEI